MKIISQQYQNNFRPAHARRGSAMVIIICAAALFSAMSLSLLFSSATLAATANRKILRMRTYEQALSFSAAFTNQLSSEDYDSELCQSIDNFLTGSYQDYHFDDSVSQQEAATYTFAMSSALPEGYGEIELILRKQQQTIHIFLSDDSFVVNNYLPNGLGQLKGDLFYYEKTLKDIDYLAWVSVRCTLNGDDGSASTVDSKFKRTVNYVPTYSLVRGGIATVIYHNDNFDWYLTADCSGSMLSLQANDVIEGVCTEEGRLYYYQITGVD